LNPVFDLLTILEISERCFWNSRAQEHGLPDPTYFANVTEELKSHGITPADIPSNPQLALNIPFPPPR
jgi:hypothetical protein